MLTLFSISKHKQYDTTRDYESLGKLFLLIRTMALGVDFRQSRLCKSFMLQKRAHKDPAADMGVDGKPCKPSKENMRKTTDLKMLGSKTAGFFFERSTQTFVMSLLYFHCIPHLLNNGKIIALAFSMSCQISQTLEKPALAIPRLCTSGQASLQHVHPQHSDPQATFVIGYQICKCTDSTFQNTIYSRRLFEDKIHQSCHSNLHNGRLVLFNNCTIPHPSNSNSKINTHKNLLHGS